MAGMRIISGAVPELEDALAEAVAAARAGDPLAPVTVVVGHSLLKPYLRRTLALRGVAQLNVRFMRPHELAEELAAASKEAREARLTPAAERVLVRQVAESAAGYFVEMRGGAGFAEALQRLFRELELGGVGTADALASALAPDDQRLTTNPQADKFAELSRLYGEFLSRRDAAGLAGIAGSYGAADIVAFEGPLFVYGLASKVPELVASLVERMAAMHGATVFLPRAGRDGVDSDGEFPARLLAAGATESALPPGDDDAPLSVLARRLLGDDAGLPIDAPNIALVSAPDTVREVWEAARACLRWAEQGIRFHEMAVVYRNRDPYRALVDEVFAEAKIETYLHDGRLLSTHPLGRRLLSLLDLAASDKFSRQQVMEFLTETQIPRATQREFNGRIRPSEWETYTREAGVVEGIEQWRTRLGRLAAAKAERAKDERFEWMARLAEPIGDLIRFAEKLHGDLARRPDVATWVEHLAYVKELADVYADGVEPVLGALKDIETIGTIAERVSFDVFCRAVRDDLESRDSTLVLKEPVREFGKRGVAVIDATSARHLRFRAVYVLGVAGRAWPPPPRPDPLLLEHERRAANSRLPSGMRLPLRTEPDDEAMTFWLVVQAAREHLAVSFARAEAGGSGKHLPSYYFRAVAQALEGRRLDLDALDRCGRVTRLQAGRLACDPVGAALSRAEYDRGLIRAHVDGVPGAAIEAIASNTPSFARAVIARRQRWGTSFSEYDGVLSGDDAVAEAQALRFAQDRAVSPSRLETYAACPYRYFLSYVLNVEPVEEPEAVERLDPLERGSLIHAVLERFLREIGRADPPREEARDRHVEILLQSFETECADRVARGVTGRPLIWEMDRRQIFEDLLRWYAEEVKERDRSTFLPGDFEASFGAPARGSGVESAISMVEPVVVRVGGHELRFQGRIDRIDWDEAREHFRVIDYKTGKNSKRATFVGGEAMQLPIYLIAASEMLQLPPGAGEAQYFYVSTTGGYKRETLTGAKLDERRAELDRILSTIVSGVHDGFFAPNPGDGAKNCQWCDYKNVCDARIAQMTQRKQGDPRGAAFFAMKDIP
jgi:ATP-dependent helicase/DNAse subunit B